MPFGAAAVVCRHCGLKILSRNPELLGHGGNRACSEETVASLIQRGLDFLLQLREFGADRHQDADTGVHEVLPPLICPTRPATYMLYEALMPLLALAVSFLISFGVTFALNMPNMTLPLFLLLLVVTLFYPKYGKSETNNKNANTSGVIALLEVAKALTPRYRGEVCFLFLDGGTQGGKGAKRLIHAHPELKKKSVVVLDCVGEGDELLILPGKTSRWNDKLLDTILEQFSNSEKKTCFLKTDGFVHYPSDNRAFTGGTVICACKKVKGFGRCILPRKATGIDEENLSLLCDGLCKLVMYYNPQNT